MVCLCPPQLEQVYHSTARKALQFCVDYQRNREFHSLCDTLSTHLNALTKYVPPYRS